MKIIWSPTAGTKIKEILEYISEDNPDAALALIDGIFCARECCLV